MPSPRRLRLLSCIFLLLTAGWLTGCDTVGQEPEPLVIPEDLETTFRFTLAAEDTAPERSVTLAAASVGSIQSALSGYGYSLAEVLSVSITAAEIRMVTPVTADLSALDSVELRLSTSGRTSESIASGSGFVDQDEAALTVVPSFDATSFVQAGTFGAQMVVRPSLQIDAEDHIMEVTLRFRVTVEGV